MLYDPTRWGPPKEQSALLIWHKDEHQEYALENSFTGLVLSKQFYCNAMDGDVQVTLDNVMVFTHWPTPIAMGGFVDPEGKISKYAKIRDLTWEEVKRLEHPDGFKIRSVNGMLRKAAELGITLCIEQKGDIKLLDEDLWLEVIRLATKYGARFMVMSLYGFKRDVEVLALCHRLGIKTGVLAHGSVVPKDFYAKTSVTWVKGTIRECANRPRNVVRLGTGSRYGKSAGSNRRSNILAANRMRVGLGRYYFYGSA